MSKFDKQRAPTSVDLSRHQIPEATLKRLVYYARCVRRFRDQGVETVLSEEIGRKCGVHGTVVRKDLSRFGEFGVRGRGYDVTALDDRLEKLFDRVGNFHAVLVGMGRLGHAIAAHARSTYKTRIVAAFSKDIDHFLTCEGIPVYPMNELRNVVEGRGVICAILAIPGTEVQSVVDALVNAGIRIVLSLALQPIQVPPGVSVGFMDVLSEMEYLFFRHHLKEEKS